MTKEMPFRADLHCHTTCSDGTMSPEELVQHAVNSGLNGLAITDHDTLDAYPRAQEKVKDFQLSLIPGVEFSSHFQKSSVHVLAYAFPWNHPALEEHCQRHTLRRQDRNQQMLDRLAHHNMPISTQDLEAAGLSRVLLEKGSYGRPHIAQAMVLKGYVGTIQEAFKRYLSEGTACYVEGKQFPIEETLEIIHAAKGLAILAHPHLIEKMSMVEKLLHLSFDGIEAYYGKIPYHQEKKWIQIAQEKQWLITGGSDFHGSLKPHISLGCSWTGEEVFQTLQAHYQSVSA